MSPARLSQSPTPRFPRSLSAGLFFLCLAPLSAEEDAKWFRAVNLNGPALTIDGHPWEAGTGTKDFNVAGKTFENQKVTLRPPTDAARTQMIRSSVWGNDVTIELSAAPPGTYQVFAYVWEDNDDEQFDLFVNGKLTAKAFHSGSEGMWKRLGPWRTESADGKITLSARAGTHGAANLSGIEIWSGGGEIPDPSGFGFAKDPTAEQLAFFEKKIRPVLAEHCYACHSADAEKLKGGLLLDSRPGVRKGGDTGPAITPGNPDASLIIIALRHTDADLVMPLKKEKLAPEVIADFEQWIRMGAPDPRSTDTVAAVKARESIDWDEARQWWSFRPLSGSAPPKVKDTDWPKNPIDHFILAQLEQANLTPAPDADRRTLIRRATFDLTGLPPTPEEVSAFVADPGTDAFVRVVEHLLASPRYGERWGRHWLDVVRYADTAGDNSDYPVPQIHLYRDWVIDALNRDLPYDSFVRDQLAGDLLGGETQDERRARTIATGYIANARRFGSRVSDYPQHLTIEDTIDNLGRSFLGLTIGCARCHDHKFDPVTAEDYYALYGIFHSTRYPWPGIELDKKPRDFVPLVPKEQLAKVDAARQEQEKEQQRLDKEVQRLKESLKTTAEPQKKAVEAQLKKAETAAAEHGTKPFPFDLAYAVAESKNIEDLPVQIKGDPAKLGDTVPRRFLTVFGGTELPPGGKSSGRAELADWILAPENPLPARVMANRIWLHHFGRGIVPTPNDFGKQGKPPTHPELLDFLAAEFRNGGWSIKNLHRLIMLSRTYQLAGERTTEAISNDPNNELVAAFPRQRLDAESIRDSLLALGGNLDLSLAGPHPFPPSQTWGYTQHKPFKDVYETDRRSVYLMTQRIQRHPFLAIFDGADPSTSTPARTASTTPLQALYLLNDPFVHTQSQRIGESILSFTGDDSSRIQRAYELLFSRLPAEDEIAAARQFLTDATTQLREDKLPAEKIESASWHAYIRVLLRLNEFIYVD